ncbi:MAG: potassium-transporting ATPase subunit C [Aeromicrobium erythreum]
MTVPARDRVPARRVGRRADDHVGRADGQQLRAEGRFVGSAIIGQDRPVRGDGWFHGRPSANDYDPLASAPSNLGPSNPDLLKAIRERRAAIAKVEGVAPGRVPADAVTASGSGLDAYVSPAYAALQVPRIARERGAAGAEGPRARRAAHRRPPARLPRRAPGQRAGAQRRPAARVRAGDVPLSPGPEDALLGQDGSVADDDRPRGQPQGVPRRCAGRRQDLPDARRGLPAAGARDRRGRRRRRDARAGPHGGADR